MLEKLPLLALSAASCVITYLAQRAGGAVAGAEVLPFGRRTANALASYITYIEKTFYPVDLSFFYPYPEAIPTWQWASAAAVLAVVTVLVILQVRRRPYLAVGWLWFVGMLVPVIGLVQVGEQALADRYTYLPLIGLFIMIVWGAADLAAARRLPAAVPAALGIVAVLVCGWLAHEQAACWANTVELAGHALTINPKNYVASDALAYHYLAQGDLENAAAAAEAAVDAEPKYACGWVNLADRAVSPGPTERPRPPRVRALDLGYSTPETLSTLGAILARQGRPAEAESPLRLAIALAPDMANAHNDLAQVLIAQGKAADAFAEAEEACRLTNRRVPMCLGTLAAAYAASGRWSEAAAAAREAAAVAEHLGHPDMAGVYNRRAALYELGQPWR